MGRASELNALLTGADHLRPSTSRRAPVPPTPSSSATGSSKRPNDADESERSPKKRRLHAPDDALPTDWPLLDSLGDLHQAPTGCSFVQQEVECKFIGDVEGMEWCHGCEAPPPERKANGKKDEPEPCHAHLLRHFVVNPDHTIVYDQASQRPLVVFYQAKAPEQPRLRTIDDFQPRLTPHDLARVMSTSAHLLAPHLKRTIEVAESTPLTTFVRRNLKDERSTCDFCAGSLFLVSYECEDCCRELCLFCMSTLIAHDDNAPTKEDHAQAAHDDLSDEQLGRLRQCSTARGSEHRSNESFQVSLRLPLDELKTMLKSMQKAIVRNAMDPMHGEPFAADDVDRTTMRQPDQRVFKLVSQHARLEGKAKNSRPTAHLTLDSLEKVAPLFEAAWKLGEPLVIDGAGDNMDRTLWEPDEIGRLYGDDKVDIQSGEKKKTTLKRFLAPFGKPKDNLRRVFTDGKYPAKFSEHLKLVDWPPEGDFKDHCQSLFEDFSAALFAPAIMSRDGALNIAAYTPSDANPVDLGPKGYVALPGRSTGDGEGSTKLHGDLSDALNIMPFALTSDGEEGIALWHIWSTRDAETLRKYIYYKQARIKAGRAPTQHEVDLMEKEMDDPVHMIRFYLTEEDLEECRVMFKICPHVIRQRPGQAVLIPAGCPHQVCNLADCIKVANDFVSLSSLRQCENIANEFRLCTKERVWRFDLLQLRWQLYYAFITAIKLARELGEDDTPVLDLGGEREDVGVLVVDEPVSLAFPSAPIKCAHATSCPDARSSPRSSDVGQHTDSDAQDSPTASLHSDQPSPATSASSLPAPAGFPAMHVQWPVLVKGSLGSPAPSFKSTVEAPSEARPVQGRLIESSAPPVL